MTGETFPELRSVVVAHSDPSVSQPSMDPVLHTLTGLPYLTHFGVEASAGVPFQASPDLLLNVLRQCPLESAHFLRAFRPGETGT